MKRESLSKEVLEIIETGRMLREETESGCAEIRRTMQRIEESHVGFTEWMGRVKKRKLSR